MIIDIKQRAVFLNRIHIFSGIRETELEGIAADLEEMNLPAKTTIFKRGDRPDGFYLIYKGKTKVTRPNEKGEEETLAYLSAGDYFGEEALFEKRNRSATLTVEEDALLLFMSRPLFDELIRTYEKLRPNFIVTIKSHKLARANRFKWLGPTEVIYFMARRHVIRLYQKLAYPILLFLIPIALFVWGFIANAVTPYAVASIFIVINILWIIWLTLDWGNDYYIVTNQRVILLEKVIGIYDSRQEAPLNTILSVGVETDFLGRQFNFGSVNVRTFVGNIKFEYVDYPEQAADMVREYWERTKSRSTQAQKDAMKNAIRAKIGMPVIKVKEEPLAPVFDADNKEAQRTLVKNVLANMFKLRQEDGETITYHKHWFVLVQQAWRPLALFLFLLTLLIIQAIRLTKDPLNGLFESIETGGFRTDTAVVTILFFMFLDFLWLAYEYWDWTNDIFMVTPDEIMDIDKKPLGTEERRTAQIESIISTEYKRIGLMGNIFNFGTVYITVGGTKLSFQDVLDPAGVMSDINRRRMVRLAKKAEDSAVADRERMATWVAAYHLNRDEFNTASTAPTIGSVTGNATVSNNELEGNIDDMLDDFADDGGGGDDFGGDG